MTNQIQIFDELPTPIEAALRASIERFGVLVPVARDQHGRTIDGHHRSRLADELGVTYRVDVIYVENDEQFREIQHTLNADRRQLSEEQRRAVAAELRREGHSGPAIAGALGVSQSTLDRDIQQVTRAGNLTQPERVAGLDGKSYPARRPSIVAAKTQREVEKAQKALAEWRPSDDGQVSDVRTVQRSVAHHQREELHANPIVLPRGPYRCIIIDPPWPMDHSDRTARPDQAPVLKYPTLAVDCEHAEFVEHDCKRGDRWLSCWERDGLRVEEDTPEAMCSSIECIVGNAIAESSAEDGAQIYLWVTHRFLPAGLELFRQWGVTYHCLMTWVKNVGMTPFSWMFSTEHVLVGYRGRFQIEKLGQRLDFSAPVQGHSIKPDIFYDRIKAASQEPRLEMFARRNRDGFDAWGNEIVDE